MQIKRKVARKRRAPGQYLTKRILASVARRAAKKAASDAMERMGFVITVEKGWVVKKYPNKTKRLHRVTTKKAPLKITLD